MKKIIISHKNGTTCAAVVIAGEVETVYTSHADNPRLVGNIYKGRVQNVLPGMQAVFIDIGRDKNVFLQTNSVQKFHVGQNVLIQIEKDAGGTKGARATLNISLAGRLVIFLPNLNYVGVSNKIRGDEKIRLHALAKKIRPTGTGIIVRTAAEGCDEETLLDDLARLQKTWAKISERNSKRKSPALLYSDNDLVEKIIRDEFTSDTEIIVDNLKIYRQLAALVTEERLTFYDGTAQIFEAFGVAEDIATIDKRELPLPSGGQIVIDKTEALTAIDVNTGKFVGRTDFEETILKTNLEAVHEIARQLRLRNIGGMVIVDFIDMTSRADKLAMMEELEIALEADKAKPQVGQLSDLGLVELTRHRQGQSLAEIFTKKCPHCQGSGNFVMEFNFATPVAEGEYRAKAAKIKLPSGTFKKNNKHNKNNNQPQIQPQIEDEQTQPVKTVIETEPSVVAAEETVKKENNKKSRRAKFEKKSKDEAVINAGPLNEEVKPVETVEEKSKAKARKPRKTKKTETEIALKQEETLKEEPKKAKRPNRGASRKTKTAKKAEE